MKRCPKCNRIYEDSQLYCLEDGASLINDNSTSVSTETQVLTRKGKAKFLPVLAGAVLLIILASIGWFVFASRENKANQNSVQTKPKQLTPTPIISSTQTPTPIQTSTIPEPTVPAETNSNTLSNGETKSKKISDSKSPDEVNSNQTTQPAQQSLPIKIEDHQIAFALQQCRKSGTSITCDFSLTNNGTDRNFAWVTGESRLFDELGNGYQGTNGQIANQKGNWAKIGFVSGVTTKSQMTFDRIEPNAGKITLLVVHYDVGDVTGLEIKFRDVPLVISK